MMTSTPSKAWDEKALLDLVTIKSGQVDPRAPEYRNLPLIAPDHLSSRTGRLIKLETAAAQGAISGKYLVKPGDVIYSKIRPYLQKAYRCDFVALCSADMYPFTPESGVDASFVLHTVLGHDFTKFATSVSARSGIPKINREELSEYRMTVPPPGEQVAIGRALDDTDNLIDTLKRLIAKKHAIKQGIMQQLLTGRTRMPGFNHPWQEMSMSEVAHIDPEALTASTDPRALIDYISLEDVERGEILRHTRVLFGSAPSRARRVIKNGDVLFGTVRPNLQSHGIYRGGLDRPIASTGFAVVRAANERSDAQFLFYLLMSDMTTVQIDRIIAGSNYPAVSSGDIRRLVFTFPPLDEQRAIGSVLADCDGEILILKRRLARTHAIKTGMMQQLLTGRTRLPVEVAS